MMDGVAVSREHILQEIRRTAADNGGAPLGRSRFAAETGIRPGDLNRYWARWSDAVREAGLTPNRLNERFPDDEVLQPLALEVRHFGRMPTIQEMRLRRREGTSLPSANVYRRYGSTKRELVAALADYSSARDDLADVAELLAPLLVEPEAQVQDAGEDTEAFGYVYLIKSGQHYKLGRTNSVGRRERELAIQLPERATTVHTISTDDPAGIEAYWHRRFADRRGNGEWFALSAADVRAFKRRRFM